MVLPWESSLSKKQVGDSFRKLVKEKMTGPTRAPETPASVTAAIMGKTFREAQIFNEKSLIKMRPLVEEFGWAILHANQTTVDFGLNDGNEPQSIPYKLINQGNEIVKVSAAATETEVVDLINRYGFAAATDLGQMLNLPIEWDGATRTVTIG